MNEQKVRVPNREKTKAAVYNYAKANLIAAEPDKVGVNRGALASADARKAIAELVQRHCNGAEYEFFMVALSAMDGRIQAQKDYVFKYEGRGVHGR